MLRLQVLSHAGEVAWSTAVEAAPLLVADERVDAEELFDRLKPFKDLVADDIERRGEGDG